MAKQGSKARPARVEIVISDDLKGKAQPNLPFRMMVLGNYTGKDDRRPMEERAPVAVNKSNFDAVMQSVDVSLETSAADRIHGTGEIPVSLRFGSLKDFRPESIARQIPRVRQLLEQRQALTAVKASAGGKKELNELASKIKDLKTREAVIRKITRPSDASSSDGGAPENTSDDS